MAAVAGRLTFAEFQSQYEHGDRSYEYRYGETVPKGTANWIHGLLQGIEVSDTLMPTPVTKIWEQLDEAMRRRR